MPGFSNFCISNFTNFMHCQVLLLLQEAVFPGGAGVSVNVVLLKVSSAKGEGDVTWVFPGGFGRGGWFSQGGFWVLGVLLLKIRKGRVWRSRYRLVCFWRES